MGRGVGIEVTERLVRVVAIDHGGRKIRVVGFGEEPVETPEGKDPVAALTEAVRKAVSKAKAGRGRVASSVDSGEAVVRELVLPFKNDDQIRRTVAFELESLVHNYSIEDLVIDHVKTGETDKGATVLALGVPRKRLAAHLKALGAAGADPASVDLDAAALFNALAKTGGVPADVPFLVLHGGDRFAKMLLVEGGKPKAMRSIRFSPPSPDEAAREREERRQVALQETKDGEPRSPIVILPEEEKRRLEDEHEGTPTAMLAKEVTRFLLASAPTAAPAHVVVSGALARGDIAEPLGDALGLPVRTHDFASRVEHALDAASSLTLGVGLGLAMKACDDDALGLDFRRGEFSFRKKFEALKTTALVTLELVVVLLAAVCLRLHFQVEHQRAAVDTMMDLHSKIHVAAGGREPADPKDAFPELLKLHRKVQEQLGGGEYPIERSALDLANQLYRAIYQFSVKHQKASLGGQSMYVLLDSVRVNQTTTSGSEGIDVTLSGIVQNLEYANALKEEILRIDPYRDGGWELQEGQYQPAPEERKRFTFTLRKGKRS